VAEAEAAPRGETIGDKGSRGDDWQGQPDHLPDRQRSDVLALFNVTAHEKPAQSDGQDAQPPDPGPRPGLNRTGRPRHRDTGRLERGDHVGRVSGWDRGREARRKAGLLRDARHRQGIRARVPALDWFGHTMNVRRSDQVLVRHPSRLTRPAVRCQALSDCPKLRKPRSGFMAIP